MTPITTEPKETPAASPSDVQRYSCFRIGNEIGMIEDNGGAWVPAFEYDRVLRLLATKSP